MESRENIKKARRDRLDPDKSSTTTLDRLMKILEVEKSNDNSVDDGPMMSDLEGNDRRVTSEELRQRLRRKIDELRGGRNYSGLETKEIRQRKRKRESESEEKKPNKNFSRKVEKDVAEAAKELKFSHVKLGNKGHEKKKRKLSKLKELQKARELEEAKKDPVKADIISKKHSWKAATSRAAQELKFMIIRSC